MSAFVSQARSAAPVSVEQYGLPVPQAKMTMRPSSKCRSALRRMNGSATLIMFSAVCTRTGTPRCSMASCMASELMTVASMPMWSAVVRSMLVPCLPRQKLPPPSTMPTSTPIVMHADELVDDAGDDLFVQAEARFAGERLARKFEDDPLVLGCTALHFLFSLSRDLPARSIF